MKLIFLMMILAFFVVPCAAQERDILASAAENPGNDKLLYPDGTSRIPEYGDAQLEKAVEQLTDYQPPFTVPKVISWFYKTKDPKIKASLLRVLAAGRDARAAVLLGNSLKDNDLDIRLAATFGLTNYFIYYTAGYGTEDLMDYAQKWWAKNQERLEKEASDISLQLKSNN